MNLQKLDHIDTEKLVPSKTNPRMDFAEDKMQELINSIREKGILQPILLRPLADGRYEIACGERRYRAAKALGLEQVPASIREMDDKTVLEVQLIENMQRSDVHPLEEAEGYEQLIEEYGYAGTDQIAEKLGKSKSYVYGRIKLLDLTTECRRMFYEGALNQSTALLVARMPQGLQKDAADDIVGLSYREACDLLQRDYMLNLKGVGFSKDNTICPELGACATCTKRTGNQELLFPEIKSADVCTDPNCFHTKLQEYVGRQQKKAEKTGLNTLKEKAVFLHGDRLAPGFVDLTEKCPRDAQQRTYKELLKKNVDFKHSLVVDTTGKIREVVKRADAEKAMAEAGVITYASASLVDGNKETNLEKERAARRLRAEVCPGVVVEIIRRVREDKEQSFWKVLAEAMLRTATGEQEVFMAQRIDKNVKRDGARAFLEAHLKNIEPSDYPDFVAELLCWPAYPGWNEYPETVVSFCDLYGIDLKATEDEAASKADPIKKHDPKDPVETAVDQSETKPAADETKEPKKKRAVKKQVVKSHAKNGAEEKEKSVSSDDSKQPNDAGYVGIKADDGSDMAVKMTGVEEQDKAVAQAGLQKLGKILIREK